ncbi:Clp protease N-terminal domain-containing protein [Actinomadura miaoliensis]|uniref:Clp protease N-terminal domain-containing protein n=1 Tax=Actinomadura miaoliensis TaxID=430685 RepID=A0ABP7WHC1_9ACTN
MSLPDLDDLIAEVDRTCATAHRRDGAQPDWIALLTTAADIAGRLQALADDLVEDYVEHCRLHGCSWTDIGSALGVSRQAAQQRFLVPHRAYDPDEYAEELRQAMTHMKALAVRNRNNYIGTEHVLWGLLAEDNSATRLLAARGASPDELRRLLEPRLTLGASQAAERIAWTPYARKALAIARDLAPDRIGCDHLLAGLAVVGRGTAADVLAEAGVDLAAVPGALPAAAAEA